MIHGLGKPQQVCGHNQVKVLHFAAFNPASVVLDSSLCVGLKNRQYTYTYTLCFCPFKALNNVVRMHLRISSGYEH